MLIDLSVVINEDIPVYPGDPKTKISQNAVLQTDEYEDHFVCLGTHVGTHVDAPSHMLAGGTNLDKQPLETFTGRGVCIVIENKQPKLDVVKQADIQEGDIVLFSTGMSEKYYTPEYYEDYPAITEEIANCLVEKRVKMVGVDMCSIDHEPFPIHKVLLQNNILIIENLTNLALLAGKQFTVYAFPIKLQLDGAPARVVASVT